ncbi:MAG: hypothetical protein JO199_10805, partial [Candidatus Eremiobacteraeota bacterium]|nr:hypothetical protein [Candidatus Eremiobacteraeota bacterium]
GSESQPGNGDFGPGHTFVASAGDEGGGTSGGGGPEQPCTFAMVVCVGGTALTQDASARGWNEVVWNNENIDQCGNHYSQPCGATGSACSNLVSKPAWQNDVGCRMRSAADISAVAAVTTPLAVYHDRQWLTFGGTSAAAPIVAGMIGLAGNGKRANVNELIWKHGGGKSLNDVVSGSNLYGNVTGLCASPVKYICVARRGYDGPTGWGTPNGIGAL